MPKIDPADLQQQANRYDLAMQAISGITTKNFGDPGELRKALAIINRFGSDLKFLGSKLIVLAGNDVVFMGSLRKACPDAVAADELMKTVRVDPSAVFGLEGGQLLTVRLRENITTDARTMARLARLFKEAAATLPLARALANPRKSAQPASTGFLDEVRQSAERLLQLNGILGLILGPAIIAALLELYVLSQPGNPVSICLRYLFCMQTGYRKLGQCTAAAQNQISPNIGLELQSAGAFSDLTLRCGFFALGTSDVMPTFDCG